ncbi:hypothetical protein ACWFR1_12105 [Streptomyces sp. NPDC055103]
MTELLRIQPAAERRRDFARWAVSQTPKLRTASTNEFAVPAALFVDAPEEILIGSLVNGHRYVSPVEDAAQGRPEPGAPHDQEHDDTGLAPTGQDDIEAIGVQPADETAPFACGLCEREYTTKRGRDTHRRQAHPEA